MKILMVCLGNICRSPLAEGILTHKLREAGLTDWQVDSAGTGGWHVGQQPDPRSIQAAKEHGIDISMQCARKFSAQDFDRYDLILAMDQSNYNNLKHLAQEPAKMSKVRLMLSYVDESDLSDVPDPYRGDASDFEEVFQLLDEACEQFLAVHLD